MLAGWMSEKQMPLSSALSSNSKNASLTSFALKNTATGLAKSLFNNTGDNCFMSLQKERIIKTWAHPSLSKFVQKVPLFSYLRPIVLEIVAFGVACHYFRHVCA